MALAQIYTAVAGHIITSARWNNEFGNIYANGTDVAFPLTKAVSYAGFTVTFDAAGVSTITSSSSQAFNLTVGSKSGTPGTNGQFFNLTAGTFTDSNTAASGTAALFASATLRAPTLAASNTLVTTTNAATFYIEGAPTAGTNETITNGYAIFADGGKTRLDGTLETAKGTDIASASSIAIPTNGNFFTVTGTTTITAISTALIAGTIIYLRFTGTGLNITHNATSMITQWARTYRTVANEVLAFLSLGSGNYTCWSVNGPPERVGVTIEANTTTIPAGYLEEDGAAVSRTTYAGLFAEISTTFGVGDGATTFNVPLTKGLAVINRDPANSIITSASVNGANAATLGGKGGAETHTLVTAELAAHAHTQRTFTSGSSGNEQNPNQLFSATIANLSSTTANAGSGSAHSNTQPWIVKKKYIRF